MVDHHVVAAFDERTIGRELDEVGVAVLDADDFDVVAQEGGGGGGNDGVGPGAGPPANRIATRLKVMLHPRRTGHRG